MEGNKKYRIMALVCFTMGITLLLFVLFSCKPTAEFYIDDKPYYTKSRCLEKRSEMVYDYHFGNHNEYNEINEVNKYKMGWGWRDKRICIRSTIDTIPIKVKKY